MLLDAVGLGPCSEVFNFKEVLEVNFGNAILRPMSGTLHSLPWAAEGKHRIGVKCSVKRSGCLPIPQRSMWGSLHSLPGNDPAGSFIGTRLQVPVWPWGWVLHVITTRTNNPKSLEDKSNVCRSVSIHLHDTLRVGLCDYSSISISN